MNKITITIPESFKSYIDASIVRASYLFPELKITMSEEPSSVEISGLDESMDLENIEKEFFNILYKERIYSETLPIRRTLYGNQNK
jgi:hypothetical protein